jgi:hypothetical protein
MLWHHFLLVQDRPNDRRCRRLFPHQTSFLPARNEPVASVLRKYGPYLASEIESLIDLVGEFPAGLDGLFALAFGKGR